MEKRYWIFASSDISRKNIAELEQHKRTTWDKANDMEIGDIAFLYLTKPEQCITAQTRIVSIDDNKIEIELVKFFDPRIPLVDMRSIGMAHPQGGVNSIKNERYVDFILNYPESLKTAQQEASKDFLQGKRVWLYKPGKQGSKWGRMLKLGLMGIGWSKLGDLRQYKNEKDIESKLNELYPSKSGSQNKLNDKPANWDMCNTISKGDIIIAASGLNTLLGYGEVVGDYFYDESIDNEFASFRKVKWFCSGEFRVNFDWDIFKDDKVKQLPIKTLTDITKYQGYPQRLLAIIRGNILGTKPTRDIPLNQILYGPPGTGKTYGTIDKALEILCERGEIDSIPQERDKKKKKFDEFMGQGQIGFVTFHQSYGYEDFVEGIRPRLSGENDESQISEKMEYEIKDGIFKRMCQNASINYEKPYILIIDEINRGNISKILGELITLLEPSKRKGEKEALEVTLPYSQEPFSVPNNLYIIGTMNTADRSIALLDTALRRRFEFIEMLPNPKELEKISCDDGEIDLKELLKAMNNRIEFLLDRERTIGHSFFFEKAKCFSSDEYDRYKLTLTDLKAVFKNKILPLLQEYFYDDYAKINAVLNDNGMLESKTMRDMEISLSDDFVDTDKRVWKITDSSQWKRWNFQKIYDNNAKKNPSPDNTESSMDSSANIANDSNAESNQNL